MPDRFVSPFERNEKRDCPARYLGTREIAGARARRSGDNPSPIVNALMELLNANVRVSRPPIRGPMPSPGRNDPIKLTSLGRLARRERNVATMNL